MSGHTPAWGRLYAILPTTGLLCAAAHWMMFTGIWRTLGAFGVIGLSLGLFALWLAGNRTALARQGDPAGLPPLPKVRVLFVYLPMRPWRLAPPGAPLEPTPLAVPAPAPLLAALPAADLPTATRE